MNKLQIKLFILINEVPHFEMYPLPEHCTNIPPHLNTSALYYIKSDACLLTFDVSDCLSSHSSRITSTLRCYIIF